jgi:hypothetical protein
VSTEYVTAWVEREQAWFATTPAHPDLAWMGDTPEEAIEGLRQTIAYRESGADQVSLGLFVDDVEPDGSEPLIFFGEYRRRFT